MLVYLLRALSRAFKRTQCLPITFDVTSLTELFRASGGVFGYYRWLHKGLVLIIWITVVEAECIDSLIWRSTV